MKDNQLTVGLVQEAWHADPQKHQRALAEGIRKASSLGAKLICLQELTLSPYFCTRNDVDPKPFMEDLHEGPTAKFVSALAKETKTCITASLFENKGFNTAVAFDETGKMIGYTRKQHIPSGIGYHEDYYFSPGDSDYPVHHIAGHKVGLPTCYDQWFPELSRIYGLKGSEILVYPTAIGGEPTAPHVDSQPMWQKVMVAQGIMSHNFIIAVNRIGTEDGLTFYGSSFISTPKGVILAEASREKPEVLIATLDFSEREEWVRLFPFFNQRQVQSYQDLVRR